MVHVLASQLAAPGSNHSFGIANVDELINRPPLRASGQCKA